MNSTEQNEVNGGTPLAEPIGSATITLTVDEIVDTYIALRSASARMRKEADDYAQKNSGCILKHVIGAGAQMQLDALGLSKLADKFYALKPNTKGEARDARQEENHG